jgi:adenylate kinase family enzyme
VLVVGSGGAGKSTLAVRLGAAWHLPVVHLDREFWQPGWVETPKPAWRERVTELVAQPRWVMDGNYGGTVELRMGRADLIVLLDLPRRVTIPRVLRRSLVWRGRSRPDMAEGCTEHLDVDFLRWLWRYPREGRVRLTSAFTEADAWGKVVRLRTAREVDAWLDGLG